jgi:hypothetical protein
MAYHLIVFTPPTYEAFSASDRRFAGVRSRQEKAAARVEPGSKLVGYLTSFSRWIGVLEVQGPMVRDSSPLFVAKDDPFDVRLPVQPLVWLAPESGIPIRDPEIWSHLELVRNYDPTLERCRERTRQCSPELTHPPIAIRGPAALPTGRPPSTTKPRTG